MYLRPLEILHLVYLGLVYQEVKKLMTEKCEVCGDCFTTVRGLIVHQRQHCDLFTRVEKSEYEVEKVLADRGPSER